MFIFVSCGDFNDDGWMIEWMTKKKRFKKKEFQMVTIIFRFENSIGMFKTEPQSNNHDDDDNGDDVQIDWIQHLHR